MRRGIRRRERRRLWRQHFPSRRSCHKCYLCALWTRTVTSPGVDREARVPYQDPGDQQPCDARLPFHQLVLGGPACIGASQPSTYCGDNWPSLYKIARKTYCVLQIISELTDRVFSPPPAYRVLRLSLAHVASCLLRPTSCDMIFCHTCSTHSSQSHDIIQHSTPCKQRKPEATSTGL